MHLLPHAISRKDSWLPSLNSTACEIKQRFACKTKSQHIDCAAYSPETRHCVMSCLPILFKPSGPRSWQLPNSIML